MITKSKALAGAAVDLANNYGSPVSQLPSGWAWTTLSAISEIKGGLAKGQKRKLGQVIRAVPYLRVANVQRGFLDLREVKSIEATPEEIQELMLKPNDVLFNEGGDRDKLGRGWVWEGQIPECIHQNHVFRARLCSSDIEPRFISWYGNSIAQGYFLSGGKQTTNLASLNLSTLRALPIPLPPAAEQRRIVTKLGASLDRIHRAKKELTAIPRLIERYWEGILLAAFRGDLTADWRDQNVNKSDSSDLVRRIEDLRHSRLQESGKGRPSKLVPLQPDWRPNIDIPSGWRWVSIDQLAIAVEYGTSSKTNEDSTGISVLRMGNISSGKVNPTELKYLPCDHNEFPSLLLMAGDVLFNRTNSADLVGKTAVYEGVPEVASFASYLIRLRAVGIKPQILSAYINSPYGRQWIAEVASQQVGQANVNGTKLRQLGIPLMSEEEQKVLYERLDAANTALNAIALQVRASQLRLGKLEKILFEKAFSGALTTQNPNDEPAHLLLERIRLKFDQQQKENSSQNKRVSRAGR